MSSIRMSPNSREVIGAISTITSKQEYLKSTNGALNVAGSFSLSGQAIPASGLTTAVAVQIVDESGNQIASFGGGTQYPELTTTSLGTGTLSLGRYKLSAPTLTDGQMYGLQLDANGNLKIAIASGGGSGGTASSFGAAFPATGTAIGLSDGTNMVALIKGQTTMSASIPVAIASNQSSIPVAATLSAETTKVIGTVNQGTSPWVVSLTSTTITGTVAVTQSGTWNITNISGTVSLPTGASTEATLAKLAVAQGSTTSGQSGTLTLGAVTTSAPTYSTTQSSPLSLDTSGNLRTSVNNTVTITGSISNTSFAVTNTGTFAVQATLSAETTKVIGTVNQGTSPWVISGTVTTTPPSNASTNIAQINGVTPLMGNGVTGTGSQRVTIASDNTAFSVNAIQSGTWNIGTVTTVSAVTAITNALPVGANVIGKVSIDQTTPGTTNAVSANQGTAAALASPWPTYNGEISDFTGTFTNATQTTSVTASGLDGYGNILISIQGTYGTATAVFEGSDDSGTTWFAVDAAQTSGSTIEGGYTALTNVTRSWQVNVPGFDSVRVRSTAVASGTVNVRMSASAALGADASTVSVSGTVVVDDLAAAPTGSTVPANAQYLGVNAATALPTAATPGNLTGQLGDKFGRQITIPQASRDLVTDNSVTITSSTAETTILTQVASTFLDLTLVTVQNTSAAASRVDFRDTTAGTVRFSVYCPAGDMRGQTFTIPRPQGTINTNWTAQSSASVASLIVYMQAIQNK